MNCSAAKKGISALIDRSINSRLRQDLLRHLEECPDCRNYQEELTSLFSGLRAPAEIKPSPYFFLKVKRKIAENEKETLPLLSRLHWVATAAAAMVMAIALLTGNFFGTNLWTAFSQQASSDQEIVSSSLGLGAFADSSDESFTAAYADTVRG